MVWNSKEIYFSRRGFPRPPMQIEIQYKLVINVNIGQDAAETEKHGSAPEHFYCLEVMSGSVRWFFLSFCVLYDKAVLRIVGVGRQGAGHDPAACARGPGSQPRPRLHQKWCWGKGFIPCAQLSWDLTWTSASSSGAPSIRRTKGWSASPVRTAWESWGCLA